MMIKHRVLMFSIFFFAIIFVGGTAAFFSAMRQIVYTDARQELSRLIEGKKFQLEGSVSKNIALVLKLADSALIKRYFLQPEDEFLKTVAFEELAGYRKALNNSVFWVNDKDKMFYFDNAASYVIDPDNPKEYWYNMTLYQTEKYNFNINYNEELKQTYLWVNAPVFDQGKPIGLVGTGIGLTDFINALYTDYSPNMPFYLFNNVSEITGAKDNSLVFDKKHLSDHFGKISDSIINAAKNLSALDIRPFNQGNAEYAVAYIPSLEWYIVGALPFTASMYLNTSMTALFIAVVLVLIGVFIIFNGFIFNMLKPLLGLEQTARSLADMDFTTDIKKFRTDEIGTIQRALIRIRDSLKKAMEDLNAHLATITVNSKRLNTVIVESSEALGLISGNMDVMQSETDTQLKSVAQTATSLDEIIRSIDSLNQAVQTQAAHITESSAAIEQMVAHITSIRSVVAGITQTTDTLSKSSAAGHSMLVKLTESINRIHEQSMTLQGANKTIADIAGQTNILAMNAAIEAAHAGESGKGFAVVAGEIRKLAELSGKESNAISEEIKKIERGVEQITGVSNETVKSMDMIFEEIKAMDASFAQVNNAVEEQAAGGSQILTALKAIQDMTLQVRAGANTIHGQSGSIHEEMEKLQRISQDVTTRAYEMKLASGSIASFLENTKSLAG